MPQRLISFCVYLSIVCPFYPIVVKLYKEEKSCPVIQKVKVFVIKKKTEIKISMSFRYVLGLDLIQFISVELKHPVHWTDFSLCPNAFRHSRFKAQKPSLATRIIF